jgi:single-strand DNA-binding protein
MDETSEWANEIRLVGRVSGEPTTRALPSGDAVTTLRVVVPRAPTRPSRDRTAPVDTIDVACWTARARRSAQSLGAGQVVAVEGSLRRRFFRAGGATASRYEVEASTVRRVGRSRAG